LHQEAGDLSSMDGVEISVCSIHVEKNIIEYSGAGAPMLLIQPGSDSWKEMKGYSSPLGGPQQLWNRETQKNGLQSHRIEYHPGDWLFLFSDGMQDQLGGREAKKLNKTPFYQILQDAVGSDQPSQMIESQLEQWMSNHQQTDDILVVGVQL
ncbi:MAG: PP2C family protein-serine/threonine phosphatase, partial [Flavobacteriales bacterium]